MKTKELKIKVSKSERAVFKQFTAERTGLRMCLAENMDGLKDFWKRIEKKYKLDSKERYSVDHKTGVVSQVGESYE